MKKTVFTLMILTATQSFSANWTCTETIPGGMKKVTQIQAISEADARKSCVSGTLTPS